ncbi:hypothetical protein Gpo141_00012297 [Globisporangium polare]
MSHGTSKRRVFPLSVETNDPWSALDSHSNSSSSLTRNGSPTAPAISGGFARGGSRAPPPPKSPLHGARRSGGGAANSNRSANDTPPAARGVDKMMMLRQMNVTSSAGYQSTAQSSVQHPPIIQQAPVATVSVPPQQQELSAAQIHKERKLAESKRRQEMQLMAQEDYTDKPEGHARLARQEERAHMQEEELRMARIMQAEKAHLRAQQLQQQREDETRIKEMYLTKLRLDREEKERVAKEKEVLRKQALELKMKALKDAADTKAREEYTARQRQIEEEALVERELRISEIESARLALEDELAGAMRQELLAEMERKQQIATEEAQWKQFEALEAQKQLEATLKRRAAQAEQYEQDKQRRMEIHRLQKERARLAEKKHKQLIANEESMLNERRVAAVERGGSQKSLLDNIVSSRLRAEGSKTHGVDLARTDEGASPVELAKGDDDSGVAVCVEAVDVFKEKRDGGDERTVARVPVVKAADGIDKQEKSSCAELLFVNAGQREIGAALAAIEPGESVADAAGTHEETDEHKERDEEPDAVKLIESEITAESPDATPEESGTSAISAAQDVNAAGEDPADSEAQPEHKSDSEDEVAADSVPWPYQEPQADEEEKSETSERTVPEVSNVTETEAASAGEEGVGGLKDHGIISDNPAAKVSTSTEPAAFGIDEKGEKVIQDGVKQVQDDYEDTQSATESDGAASTTAFEPSKSPSTTLDDLHNVGTTAPDSEPEQQEALPPLNQSPTAQLISAHDAQTQGLNPFAQVLHVKDGSPAMEASLQAGDLLVDFGGITSSTANCLLLIAKKVKNSVNREIELVVLRPEQESFIRESLSLRPRKWQGKGLLGCQLNPFKWTEEQDPEPEAASNSDPTTATEHTQDPDDSTSLLLVFYNVAPESIADQVGVKNGDLLMKCGALETVNDLVVVAEYLQAAKAEQTPVELEIQRWIPEEQQYQQVVLELPTMSSDEPLGCSLTTFAEYYSSSEASAIDVNTSALSACMDCYYTTLATSVHAAALNGHVSCLEALYEASRQDENATVDPEDQQYNNSTGSSVLDWRDSDGRSPLFYACYAQQVDSIRFLLAHMAQSEVFDPQTGADLYGDSPLHAATLSGSAEIVSLLLESKYIAVDVVNATQLACVHLAPSFEVLELLGEKYNADLLAIDTDGRMPLSHACLRNDLESVTYLCEKHPDFVDYADASGNTPLHLSAWLGFLDVIKILIKYLPPIALYMPNQDGSNPLEIAQASGSDETAQFLEQCMAASNQDDDECAA